MGLMATYRPGSLITSSKEDSNNKDVMPVTVHRHLKVTLASRAAQKVRTLLKVCADEICETNSVQALEELRGEEDLQGLKSLVSEAVTSYLHERPCVLELMKDINENCGWGGSEQLATDDCIAVVRALVEVGPCYVFVEADDSVTWCVD